MNDNTGREELQAMRLSASDERHIIAALRRLTSQAGWTDMDALERAAAHEISCTLSDLRDGEREWIRDVAAKLIATHESEVTK